MEKTIRRKVNTVIMKLGRNATCNLTWANGRLSNFDAVASYFSDKGYKIVIGFTYIHSKYFKKRKSFAKYVKDFITFKGFDRVILLEFTRGHIALYHTKCILKKLQVLS
jgi:hypothetical protein